MLGALGVLVSRPVFCIPAIALILLTVALLAGVPRLLRRSARR